MGIFGNLFKSDKEREKDLRKAKRAAFRTAENSLGTVKERIAKLEGEHQKAWREAKGLLKDGQKAAAERKLQSCRAIDLLIKKVEVKRWVFESLMTKLELAGSDQDFAKALGALDAVVKIDPEAIDDVMGEIEEKLGEQGDVDKIWERSYQKEMEGAQSQADDTVPSIDEMAKQLEDEVAAEIGGDKVAGEKDKTDDSVKTRITEGRSKLKDLMGGGK